MAIYHFSAKVISRSAGSSAVASAAYRSAERLHDDRLDRTHDFTSKSGVVHSEVMLPEGAPERLGDRSTLWNEVEATELRKDAQLSREIEFAIPRELNQQQGIELARDFVQAEFVERGMIADLNVHWDVGADGLAKPHAHVMLSMREVSEDGFGKKVRDWNRTELIETWRERWAEHVNERLAELDIDARIDHRSLEAQGIDLEPQTKIGAPSLRMGPEADRLIEHHAIARENGERIIANPDIALDAITKSQATFTRRDLARFVHRHSDGKDQFDRALSAVESSPDLVALGKDGRGQERFTSRDMIEVEARLERATASIAERDRHRVHERFRDRALAAAEQRGLVLSGEQRAAFEHATAGKDLGVVVGYAGTGKSAMLGVAREAWESAGYNVRGAALSGIAAEGLENGSGIASRTIASLEHQWSEGRDLLTSRDVLVIDEAGMVGTRQIERVLSVANDAGAKVVLVGDPQQLQAIEAGAAFRAIHERHGGVEITEVRRQREDWQRDATRHLATGRTGLAIEAYDGRGMVHVAETRDAAREELIEGWNRERVAEPDQSRIILTHTNDEVRALNELARGRLREDGALGEDVSINAERGNRDFASGDRLMFLRNDRELGVKNGSLGTVQSVSAQRMVVQLDDGRSVDFDTKDYAHVDHGYAATIHKSQGVTVDRAHVLATPGMDQHSSYVALSRHRDSLELHYGKDDFADGARLARTLSRERAKDMVSDYGLSETMERRFAERRGISFRERIAEIVRKVPEKVRGMFDGLRVPQAPAPEADRQVRAQAAVRRHARAVSNILMAQEDGTTISQLVAQGRYAPMGQELAEARKELNAFSANYSRDIERAYLADQPLAHEAANGQVRRAILAMKAERRFREAGQERSDQFVERWQKLQRSSQQSYKHGEMSSYRSARTEMASMAKSLERDPQLESLLASRKAELGIGIAGVRSLGRELAFHHGLDLGRGRGIAI
ncbi:MAG TPA: Ti-type conjugative transfer relaxase TraA [Erythrobacter sp.]|jgi:Ti-type conjugative transfer relaxase TraA|uniref:Ti-type conjugative transfer relaxase TraA n=1 Tax=Erythrobacter sp. MTPC3 TaxID=3056564 RepID=UPI000EDF66F5|nr:Ti-type conjugative transfer relaxase TraA [Erythrobacter sp.]|tara:strand:- start:4284 stop:7184 length:2901 start_codon:yes stop_codon:yes gene_type:complete